MSLHCDTLYASEIVTVTDVRCRPHVGRWIDRVACKPTWLVGAVAALCSS